MFDILKKKTEESKVGAQSSSSSEIKASLEPPNTLPDLARDIYEKEEMRGRSIEDTTAPKNIKATPVVAANIPDVKISIPKVTLEPSKEAVPKLDMNLLREYSKSLLDNVNLTSSQKTEKINSDIYPTTSDFGTAGSNIVKIDGGFFKEFQDFIARSDISDESKRAAWDELLYKDLLDKMIVYHNNKDTGLPFYLSNNELAMATRQIFEELKNLEHGWMVNKQKLDILNSLNKGLESDIKLKSEELKKLLYESMKRNIDSKKEREMNTFSESAALYRNSNASSSISDPSKYFYMCNGIILHSITDLILSLASIDDETFRHHVNAQRNDFSNWIGGVFNDIVLANSIRTMLNKEQLRVFLLDGKY